MTRLRHWLSVLCRGVAYAALGGGLGMLAKALFPATLFHLREAIDAFPWWGWLLAGLCYGFTPWRWPWGRWVQSFASELWHGLEEDAARAVAHRAWRRAVWRAWWERRPLPPKPNFYSSRRTGGDVGTAGRSGPSPPVGGQPRPPTPPPAA
jgi:hypothetical protein